MRVIKNNNKSIVEAFFQKAFWYINFQGKSYFFGYIVAININFLIRMLQSYSKNLEFLVKSG